MRKVLHPLAVLIVCLSAQLASGQLPASGSEPIAGQLVGLDGRPLAGVRMCLTSWRLMIWSPSLPADDPRNPPGCSFSTTDKSGHFSFPPQKDRWTLLVFTDDGYVIAKSRGFTFPLTIHLTPWAKLHGVLTVGDRAAPAGITVRATYVDSDVEDELGPWPYFNAVTDRQGQFDFGRVLAGSYSVYRTLTPQVAGIGVPVTAPAGRVTACAVPVIGQDVHGRFELLREISGQQWYADAAVVQRIVLPQLTLPANILGMTGAQRVEWYDRWEAQTAEGRRHAIQRQLLRNERFAQVQPDGSFLVADLASGSYALQASFFPVINNQADFDRLLANPAYDFKVAGARGTAQLQTIELGVLPARAGEITNAGQIMPDIAFRTSSGPDRLLSQFRGKVVLLDFWGAWCGACREDLPNMKQIFDAYGSRPNFAMVSLSVGDDYATWKEFIRKNRMNWPQGFLGAFDDAWQAKLFCVSRYPSYWLVGPDGKVLADSSRSDDLLSILHQAVGELK